LKRELANSGYSGAKGQRNKDERDPRDAVRQHLDKNAPLKDVWLNFQKAATVTDVETGASQSQRFCDAMELYANVRDSPLKLDDPLCDDTDPIDERNQKRILQGLVLWAQAGRC
jgi:hypothetical protein